MSSSFVISSIFFLSSDYFFFTGGFSFVLLNLCSILLFVGIGETAFYFITCETGIWFALLDEMLEIIKLGLIIYSSYLTLHVFVQHVIDSLSGVFSAVVRKCIDNEKIGSLFLSMCLHGLK